jgi:hypothetical protein
MRVESLDMCLDNYHVAPGADPVGKFISKEAVSDYHMTGSHLDIQASLTQRNSVSN